MVSPAAATEAGCSSVLPAARIDGCHTATRPAPGPTFIRTRPATSVNAVYGLAVTYTTPFIASWMLHPSATAPGLSKVTVLLAATRVVLSRGLVLNATMRAIKANQFGLLGFGGDRHDRYRPQFEGSAGVMLSPRLVVGVEGRSKPSNLHFAREQKAVDAFAAWAVARTVSLTAAFVDLGDIATARRQRGAFLSVQGSF